MSITMIKVSSIKRIIFQKLYNKYLIKLIRSGLITKLAKNRSTLVSKN